MSASSSWKVAPRTPVRFQTVWQHDLGVRPRGLAMVAERGWLLIWDEKSRLHLFDRAGRLQAQCQMPAPLMAATATGDGSRFLVALQDGGLCWLHPDLSLSRQQVHPGRPVAVCLDAFGRYLAVADAQARLAIYDVTGRNLCQVQCPRPLHQLAFATTTPLLFGSADYGLVAGYDLMGRCLWLDGLVSHIGSLSVIDPAEQILLACYTEGLQRYHFRGRKGDRVTLGEPACAAAPSVEGRYTLVASYASRLYLVGSRGQVVGEHPLDEPAVAISLAPLGEMAYVGQADGQVYGLRLLPPR